MEFEENTYSTIFNALKHPIRRRILRILDKKPSTYTEIQSQLKIDNGLQNYHLDNMRSLLNKDENNNYSLSDFGRGAMSLLERVEQPVSNRMYTILGLSPLQIKSAITILIVCLGVLAFYNIELNNNYDVLETQYDSLILSKTEAQKSLESEIVYETLQIAILEEQIPGYSSITHNTSTLVLSTKLIENIEVPSRVGRYRLLLLSPEEIEAKAEAEGDFMYLVFTKFEPNPKLMMVTINTKGIFDAGGSLGMQFKLSGLIYVMTIH